MFALEKSFETTTTTSWRLMLNSTHSHTKLFLSESILFSTEWFRQFELFFELKRNKIKTFSGLKSQRTKMIYIFFLWSITAPSLNVCEVKPPLTTFILVHNEMVVCSSCQNFVQHTNTQAHIHVHQRFIRALHSYTGTPHKNQCYSQVRLLRIKIY